MKLVKNTFIFCVLVVTLIVAGCSTESSKIDGGTNTSEDTKNEGGESVLNVAMDAPPPTLDQPTSSAVTTQNTSRAIFEPLITVDSSFKAVPMLADQVNVSDDNKTYTFTLREGIKFHDGNEMTSKDVVASMERWMEISTSAGNIFEGATWSDNGEYEVILDLEKPSVLTLDALASDIQGAAVMPKEIIESASAEGVSEYIGTGPFKLEEWKQDQYIHLTKYEDYQALDTEADGLAGKKEALVDDIFIHIVPDSTTRLTGLETGEYDLAYGISYDDYERVNNDPNLETLLDQSSHEVLIMNRVEGPVSDPKMRQAINIGLDKDEIMMAAFPNEDLYTLESGYMNSRISNWESQEGSEYYNQNDPEKAKEILEEIDYNGEEIVFMTTRDYDDFYNASVVVAEQLKGLGINVSLEVVDWPTLVDARENELDKWDISITSFSLATSPTHILAFSPSWAGGVNDDKTIDMIKSIENAPDQEAAKEVWDKLQEHSWAEHLPIIQLGAYNDLFGMSSKVKGVTTMTGPIYWNVSVED